MGISWYEAVAYARFRKQMLPTIHHWMRAAFTPYDPMFPTAAAITKQSRFFADGPESARSEHGLGPWGTYHMAGNAREWVWNFAGGDAVALGSGWPEYASNFARDLHRGPDGAPARPWLATDAARWTIRRSRPRCWSPSSWCATRHSRIARRFPMTPSKPCAFSSRRRVLRRPRSKVNHVDESPLWIADEVTLTFAAQEPTTLYLVRPKVHRRTAATHRVLRRRRLLLHEATQPRRARATADRGIRREQRPRAGDAGLGRRLRTLLARAEAGSRGHGSRARCVAAMAARSRAPRSTISSHGPTWTCRRSAISGSAAARALRARSISRSSRASARPCSPPAASGSTARCIR